MRVSNGLLCSGMGDSCPTTVSEPRLITIIVLCLFLIPSTSLLFSVHAHTTNTIIIIITRTHKLRFIFFLVCVWCGFFSSYFFFPPHSSKKSKRKFQLILLGYQMFSCVSPMLTNLVSSSIRFLEHKRAFYTVIITLLVTTTEVSQSLVVLVINDCMRLFNLLYEIKILKFLFVSLL